jgi:hypothetical protein
VIQGVVCETGTLCLNTIYTISIPINESGETRGICVQGEVHTGLWWGNLREKDNLEDLRADGGQC